MTTDGLIVIDKPAGITSHDVVARVRRIVGSRKVGHAGTLDPMATGVLVLGVAGGTRLLTHLVLTAKSYRATIRLGAATTTDDAEGEPIGGSSAAGVDENHVRAGLAALTGVIRQVPSSVSAIKVDGRRAYARVRAGEVVELAAREVTISRFELRGLRRPSPDRLDLEVAVDCSAGTYVRALARDLGAGLGVGGHLTALRRTRVGPFTVGEALTLEDLAGRPDPVTLPLAEVVPRLMPTRVVTAAEADQLSYGRPLPGTGVVGLHAAVLDGTVVALLHADDPDAGGNAPARPVLVWRARG
ncbi:MAG: tRNA pseudouridine(55) synthase TruB [Actinomycetota bacterium]|nr:tRNA pseudouridine(55) synthase TruB [Actinomycetota bacterium]